jgi:hypothetical protein
VAGKTRASIPARVPCARLDSWIARLGVDPDRIGFVKVDTQGWELRVLLGAPALLARRRAVWQVEFSPQMLHRAQNDVASAYEMFRAHFTHFIDLRRPGGARGRPTTEVAEALAYVGSAEARYTNLLLYNVY